MYIDSADFDSTHIYSSWYVDETNKAKKFANIYNLPQDELIISWQSDKVAYDLLLENHALEILKVAESKVEYLKTKKK